MPARTLRLRPEVSHIGCAVLTRLAEVLRPIDHLAATPVDRECDAHLAESRGHDVGAVMRTREPARDRLLRRPRSEERRVGTGCSGLRLWSVLKRGGVE